MVKHKRAVHAILATILIGLSVFLIRRYSFERHQGLSALLGGEKGIEILSCTMIGQGKRISANDSSAMRYLSESFRGATKDGYVPSHDAGYTFRGEIELSGGISVMVGCNTPDNADGLTVAYPYDSLEDPTYYWVSFAQPMPATVSVILTKMRQPPCPPSK